MRCVAFMRNVNQGQRRHPSTSDIVAGFADAGCADIQTFQSNGTIVFESDEPAAVVEQAADAVAARSGHEREILWIPLSELAAVVDEHGATPEPRRFELTLHGGALLDPHDPLVVSRAAEHRCSLTDAGKGWALVRNDVEGEGHATPLLESLTGRRATSRGLPTVIRLVSRFGR
jgi:hypothetical protein